MLNGIILPVEPVKGVNAEIVDLFDPSLPGRVLLELKSFEPFVPKSLENDRLTFSYLNSMNRNSPDPVFIYKSCGSAMNLASELKVAGLASDWASVLSVFQTGGRGRFGRRWESIPGNIHASVIYPEISDEFSFLLAMLIGVIIAECLRSKGFDVSLKWPNDIVFDGRKVAGILVEKRNEGLIAGIGINIHDKPAESMMRHDCGLSPGVLAKNGEEIGFVSLWLDIIDSLKKVTYEYVNLLGLRTFIRNAESMLLWKGEAVRIADSSSGDITGRIKGLGETGGLLISGDDGEYEIFSGTVVRLNNL